MGKFWKKILGIKNKDDVDTAKSETSNSEELINSARKITLSSYGDVRFVTKVLIEHKKVLVDLSNIEKTERRRIIDFLSGVIFSNNGKVIISSKNNYLFIIEN